ncbi:MAG: rubrerythrin family protein [Candidatus Amulumruptor caecigallinarius]|nr:rubrerythrin family protein [Candidatus Amulumruptor caecigallinarius]MCM1396039.1 rubrerythrin family protein [Candidatus Amulumruptor caecigallinarius]MCM1453038.1 rubrerythrin family protein [bacterium]
MSATKSIKGTKTEQNLVNAFAAETQAYCRYTYYAQAADKEQYFPIGEVFRDTAANELHHAKVFLKMLEGGAMPATGNVDAGYLGATAENLAVAIKEEEMEGYMFYTEAAKIATEEGFPEIAAHFTAIASVEKHHHDRFQKCLEMVNAGTLWKRDEPINWVCLVCGYIYKGKTPPVKCPGCDHPYQHYMPEDFLEL